MKHHWWWTELLVNLLEKAIRRDPLVNGYLSSFDAWREDVERGKVLRQFMEKEPGDFYALMKIADDVCVVGGRALPAWLRNEEQGIEKSICLTISLEWSQRVEARRVYGGAFPDHVKRAVFTSGGEVVHSYIWMGRVNDTAIYVFVEFRQEAADGEEFVDGIAGCTN